MDDLEPLDPSYVEDVLSRLPFVSISGVINSSLRLRKKAGAEPSYPARDYNLHTGKAQMKDLGITAVFDLRSDTEIEKYNTPLPTIEGVEVHHVPVFQKEDYSPEMMARRYQLYASGKTEASLAFMELYSQILDSGGPAFGSILRHVRDRPSDGCLFHCTAGKDRTGVIAAILLKLAGVDNQAIAHDYALTRIGREPAREMIMERLSKEPLFASNSEAAMNMFTCRSVTMSAFLDLLDAKYSGAEGYCKNIVGLSDEDISVIRQNLLVPSSTP
ncbi:unnamed protein product [Mycena citricolor]|uniref:Tyrosine specific protein phosphatases domain-containing protein n=1 Tax=Mycena citricolor TaxID=2018698 RepID=A0AAD2HHH9_9AGAR|nr:unnamed protein product [Mycena citricolor]